MSKNTKIFLALAVFFFIAALVFAGGSKRKGIILQSGGKAFTPEQYAAGQVLVIFKKGISLAEVNSFANSHALKALDRFDKLSKIRGQEFALFHASNVSDIKALVSELKKMPQVEAASPNYRRFLAATPNDTYYASYLWGMNNTGQTIDGVVGTVDADIDAPEAWDIRTGSSNVIVAVIDTGFDYTHPDLAANAWTNPGEIAGNNRDDDGNGYIDDIYGIDAAGWNGASNGASADSDPMDGYGHGTHCAGTVGAVGNNSRGVVGVNWNVKIMGLKFFDDDGGNAYDSFAIKCIEYAIWEKLYHGQNVVAINASWGGTGGAQSDPLRYAIDDAGTAGIVFCAAAGNGGSDGVGDNNDTTPHYPSSYDSPNIISVAATNNTDALTSFSNYGLTSVDLGAPGEDILSTVPGEYVPQSGDLFFDNFEGSVANWTHGGTRDAWAISTNVEVFTVNPVPSPTHFWSDRLGNYQDATNAWLAYNANINLSSYTNQEVFLGMGTAFNLESGWDFGYIEISNNGGGTWAILASLTGGSHWYNYSWRIPQAYKTNQFRMRFRLSSDTSVNYQGWLIDNVGIKVAPTLAYAYESWGGTSMACPHVAGAVGLMASEFPSEIVAQRKKRILDNGDAKASLAGRCVTGRRLNLFKSITASSPTADPALTVTSPNGGEVWARSRAYNITWTSAGTVGNVNIDYSTNNGGTWISVASNTANDGIQSWTTPNVNSTNCLVRVQETDGTPTDRSDAVFSLANNPAETVSLPSMLNGPVTGSVNQYLNYVTDGSISSQSHPVQYYFDFGDGTNSGWLAVGTTTTSKRWAAAGTYSVRVRARCATHTSIVSAFFPVVPASPAFLVIIYNEPTWSGITRFGGCAAESQPTVEWHTAGEAGAVGFNLWRQDRETKQFELVNSALLPALTNSPQGGIYRFSDPGAFSGEPVVYRLEEIDAQGRSMSYGPFTVTFGAASWDGLDEIAVNASREESSGIYGYQRFERGQSIYEQERLSARRQERQRSSLLAVTGKNRAKITVKGRGLFYVTSAQVARSLGLTESTVAHLISARNLSLTSMGKNIAWLADRNGAGLFFYNEGIQTPYSDRNVFWLERGSGLAMEVEGGGSAGPADAGQTFRDSLHFEENRYALLIGSMNPAGDLWFWDYVVAGGEAKSFAVQVPGVAAAGNATLNIRLQGATDTAADSDHHAIVSINGTQIGEAFWDGTRAHEFAVDFSASLLQDGANTITVSGALDTGAPYSTFYVEDFDLSCQRYYRAVGDNLLCRGDGNSVVTVSGMTEPQVAVLDVSNPVRPKYLSGVAPDVSGRVTFVPRSAANTYLVSGLNAALRPLAVAGDSPSQLKSTANSAEYVVIAPEEFKETAKTLAAYRRGKGLKSLVVTLEDIYESFNYGMPSPRAIRDFLAYASAKWGGARVKYAVLAGKGTYDYNDYQGQGDNLVPVILVATPNGLCAADKTFGDVRGTNGLPEIAIGRLPAVTNAELQAMIGKIKAFEGGRGAWTDRALFIADDADGGGDFAQSCNDLASLAAGYTAEKFYLNGAVEEIRDKINAAWNVGAALVTYCGHAGLNQLAMENLFHVSDAAALRNGGQLPLAAMFTCAAGRFEIPGFTSLGEALLLNVNGGAAAGLFPDGAAMNADSLRLGEEFYKAMFRRGDASGPALVAAMTRYLQLGGPAYLLNIYNWLGDPALKAK